MKKNIAFLSIFAALLAVAINYSAALAQVVEINYTARGNYDSTGFHYPDDSSYFAGDSRGSSCSPCGSDFRNFFVFDLAPVSQPVSVAILSLFVPMHGNETLDDFETFELHDVVTPISSLIDGTAGLTAHADLGSGLVYGSRMISNQEQGIVVSTRLNAAAIDAINSARGGLFAIGGSITTLDNLANNEYTFRNSSNPQNVTELRLVLVPEPTSAGLIAFAAIIFGSRRRRMTR